MKNRVRALILIIVVTSTLVSAQHVSWTSLGGDDDWELTIDSETNHARLRDNANGERILVDFENAQALSEYIRSLLVRLDEDDQNFELRDSPTFIVTYRKGEDVVTRRLMPLWPRRPSIAFNDAISSEDMIEIDKETRTGLDRLLLTNLSVEMLAVLRRLDDAGLNKWSADPKE